MGIARSIELVSSNWTESVAGVGCIFTGNSGEVNCGYDSVIDPDSGLIRNSRAVLTLKNNSEIFDFSGNVREWTDWDSNFTGFQIGPTTCLIGSDISVVNCPAVTDTEFNSLNGGYDRNQGVGYFFWWIQRSGNPRWKLGEWYWHGNLYYYLFLMYPVSLQLD